MAAIRSRKDRKQQNPEQPASVSSASVYRSRALIQSLSNAVRAARVEGPPVPGGSTHSTTGSTHSLKSKLELLGPTDGEELMSEGQRQLQLLLRKQLDTSSTFETTLKEVRGKEFTPAVVFKPLANEVKGLHSLDEYQNREEEYSKLDQLRQMGLTTDEIKLNDESQPQLSPAKRAARLGLGLEAHPAAKRIRLGLGADPMAQKDRLEALNQKLLEREKILCEPIKYAGAKPMSRHAMEVERSMFRETSSGNPLRHLTVEDHQHAVLYPKRVIPDKELCSSARNETDTAVTDDGGRETLTAATHAATTGIPLPLAPEPLPVQVIERNRLSMAEIRALPRFRDYSPGTPSKVLFLKNLHHKVTEDDLLAVFGCCEGLERGGGRGDRGERGGDGSWMLPCSVRVMSGKMKGQAFIEFHSVEAAMKAMELANGYVMREKPLIISYGRARTIDTQCTADSAVS